MVGNALARVLSLSALDEDEITAILALHGQKGKPGYELLHSPDARIRTLANKIYKEREAAGDSSLQAQADIQHQAKAGHMAPDLLKEIKGKGGFTYNPGTLKLIEPGHGETGFAIAVPHTEELVGNEGMSREEFAEAVTKVGDKHTVEMEHGANLGGWKSDERNTYMVELSEIHHVSRKEAIRIGQERNQEAILDMETGEFINTGGTGG
jgi:hypothetical protein